MSSELRFDDRVVVITGAGGGLGSHYSRLLASRGAQLVCNDLGGALDGSGASDGPAQRIADEVTASGGIAIADTNTVNTPEGGAAIIAHAIAEFGRVDVVINNAGILRDKSFANMTNEMIDTVIDVHLRGAFHVAQPAWAHMKEQNYGRVINTTSQSGLLGAFGQANYGAAKMGLVGFTRVLAAEGAKYNIKANAIAPLAKTRMTEELLGPVADKLHPSQVAPVVAMLAHENCPVTGEVYSAAGGRVARFFVGLTQGFFEPELTPESVLEHIEQIRDTTNFMIPASPAEEVLDILKHFPS